MYQRNMQPFNKYVSPKRMDFLHNAQTEAQTLVLLSWPLELENIKEKYTEIYKLSTYPLPKRMDFAS